MKQNNDFNIFLKDLRSLLKDRRSTKNVFNQYRDFNISCDIKNAAEIRLQNLSNYVDDVKDTASVLVVGEAAGPWGCRFSGVPFTGEKQILEKSFPINGDRSSKITLEHPEPFSSKTAKMFWDIMLPYYENFLAWDALPYHSHKENILLSVRNPTDKEILQYKRELNTVKNFFKPQKIVAVGRRAETLLKSLGIETIYVRHPSRGGKNEFKNGMQKIFSPDINSLCKNSDSERASSCIEISDFESYVIKNAGIKTYHTVRGTPFKFKLLKPKDKISEFHHSINFYSKNWSNSTIRRVGPKETIRFIEEFNENNLKPMTMYKNKGEKSTTATRFRFLMCLFKDFLNTY